MRQHLETAGVYANLQDLIRLRHQAAGFSFLPKQPVHSLLSGRHASRLRGRGLDFEELRQCRPGDDIRNMDWKVTRRTRKPYIRVYTEERERPVIIVVDQRISMFFGSQVNMKSVTAAEAAALGAWRVVSAGDRAGAIVFNDTEIKEIKSQRSRKTVMQILKVIIEQNNALGVDRGIIPAPGMLDKVLQRVVHLANHDYLICIISDFDGMTADTHRSVKQMSRHNDVMLFMIYDLLAKKMPDAGPLAVSDGKRQMVIDSQSSKLRKKIPELLENRLARLKTELERYGVPVLPIHTAQSVAGQVRKILGYTPGKRTVPIQKLSVRGAR